jgi:hypothetical protein
MIITKSYCHNVLVSVSTFLDFEKLVSFFCFFSFFLLVLLHKKWGRKREKKYPSWSQHIKKNCTEMVVNEGGNRTSNEEIKDF